VRERVNDTQCVSAAYPRLVDEHRAAAILCLSVKTLRRHRWLGEDPPYIKLGRSVRYDVGDLEQFIARGRRGSTSEARAAA
jgi:hypothetical protein